MSWLRYKLGVWCLGPILRDGALIAHQRLQVTEEKPRQEGYYQGRFAALSDVLYGDLYHSAHEPIANDASGGGREAVAHLSNGAGGLVTPERGEG